ncbi:MAG: DUF1080 domain-containing protein, partial [Planctomycetales bacterium]
MIIHRCQFTLEEHHLMRAARFLPLSLLIVFSVSVSVSWSQERGEPIALFDGESLQGWTSLDGKPIKKGWIVEDGVLFRKERGGPIVFDGEFRDFELTFEWKIAPKGNSGLKYRVRKYGKKVLGCEFQLLDDGNRNRGKGSAGALYALYEPGEAKKL